MIKPLNKDVLIEPITESDTTDSGIIITTERKQNDYTGIVVSCGESVTSVRTGDKVMYAKYSGTPVSMDGHDYLLMHESDLLAVII